MRHNLKAVFADRSKAQQALDEWLATGYPRADAVLVTVPGVLSRSTGAAPAPRWRQRPGASAARLLSRILGQADSRPSGAGAPSDVADSHVLTLSTDSAQEADRAASLVSGFMQPGDTAAAGISGGPAGMTYVAYRRIAVPERLRVDAGAASRPAYRFGRDMHGKLRYRNRSWPESHADLKVLWEAGDPARPGWDASAPAIRLGWDSASPETDDSCHRGHRRTAAPHSAKGPGADETIPSPGRAPERGDPVAPTAWEHFMDALRHGWNRTRIGHDMDESDYRLHHARTYPGTNYDDLAPVYRFGHQVRRRAMFQERSWDEAQVELRAEWERGHREGKPATWDEMQAALRAGWGKDRS